MLRITPYDRRRHHPVLTEWWRARDDDDILPEDVLPPTGCVTCDGDEPIAACSIWLTNANTAFMAFPIAKPGLSPRLSHEAISLAVAGCIDLARKFGVKIIWGTTANRAVSAIFERAGLTRTNPHHNHFMLLDPSLAPDTMVDHAYFERKD